MSEYTETLNRKIKARQQLSRCAPTKTGIKEARLRASITEAENYMHYLRTKERENGS